MELVPLSGATAFLRGKWAYRSRLYQPDTKIYIYSDRPIYRPGQTIYFRAVLRNSGDARYLPTVLEDAEFNLVGDYNIDTGQPTVIDSVRLQVSPYGTVNGVFDLPENIPPGNYTIQLIDGNAWLPLQVAEYRKPEIDVQVDFSLPAYRSDEDLQAQISANYYFGGAVNGVEVRWTLYAENDYFSIPGGFTTGKVDTRWLNPAGFGIPDFGFGVYLTGGTGTTGADGSLKAVLECGGAWKTGRPVRSPQTDSASRGGGRERPDRFEARHHSAPP